MMMGRKAVASPYLPPLDFEINGELIVVVDFIKYFRSFSALQEHQNSVYVEDQDEIQHTGVVDRSYKTTQYTA